jgi:hypothetical protein
MGMYFGHVRVSDLMLVNHDGDIVFGNKSVNQAGLGYRLVWISAILRAS